jgi:S-formylglutathione hydrolase
MIFGLYLPSKLSEDTPVLYWLSGLTCDDTNFAIKAGSRAFAAAEIQGIALVMPDTSPRGEGVPNVDSYDLGVGAGFYVNATEEPYSTHYHMYNYITQELPAVLKEEWGIGAIKGISGHSMGGHGALTIALKSPSEWASVSAFSQNVLGEKRLSILTWGVSKLDNRMMPPVLWIYKARRL